jgi:predicted ester cyclase
MDMDHDAVVSLLRRDVTVDEYDAVRDLWVAHSKAEDARDLAGLMATLVPDCVYELPQAGHRWDGHEGATRFYTELLGAFPDIDFQLRHITIGPQGVCEEARVTATSRGTWLGRLPTHERVEFTAIILFPWDPHRRLFTGERVYVFGIDLSPHHGATP